MPANSHKSYQRVRTIVIPDDELLPQVKQLVSEGHTVTIRVKGNSMRPLLENERDKAIISPFSILNKGDIVLAEIFSDKFVLHRIIRICDNHVTLMGDGNIRGVEECMVDNVIGLVTSVVRNGEVWQSTDLRWRLLRYIWPRLKFVRRYLLAVYNLSKK